MQYDSMCVYMYVGVCVYLCVCDVHNAAVCTLYIVHYILTRDNVTSPLDSTVNKKTLVNNNSWCYVNYLVLMLSD